VRLWSRQGRSGTREFAAITAALRAFPVTQVVLDREAVAHGPDGLPDFSRLLSGNCASACFFAFDVLMLGGDDLRPLPLSIRRNMLAELPVEGALQFSGHMDGPDGAAMFRHACWMGLEGIVSKRADKPYRSGPCRSWLKVKNRAYERAAVVE
jgi:bifunctional non-homologous end joining protein LigD